MTGIAGRVPSGVCEAASIEQRLSQLLAAASAELARAEYLDEDQRGEVYAVLQALREDTQAHQSLAVRLAPASPAATIHIPRASAGSYVSESPNA